MFQLIIHLPDDHKQRIEIQRGQRQRLLTDVLRSAGHPLNTRCGQRGLCDGCVVWLRSGGVERAGTGQPIDANSSDDPIRGCEIQLPTSGEAEIQIPIRSLLTREPQIVTSFLINVPRADAPLWQPLRIAQTDLADDLPLASSLRQFISAKFSSELQIDLEPELIESHSRSDGWLDLSIENHGDRWAVGPRRFQPPAYGAAVDIGTTTVVVAIVELETGRVAASVSALNAQVKLGDNVLTRINLCMNHPEMTGKMQDAILQETLFPLLQEAVAKAGIDLRQLAALVVAGNSTMLHLLDGVDPSSMGVAPFTPSFLQHRVVRCAQWQEGDLETTAGTDPGSTESVARAKGQVSGNMAVHLLPGAAAYIGSDITSGILASGMAYRDETCLLVDIGTNGEIVLQHDGKLLGCATAAGPAFEGAGLACGMRAGEGAISHIMLAEETLTPEIEMIGTGKPIGICGTAYIDFVARARAAKLISQTARFSKGDRPELVDHGAYGRAFVVGRGQGGEPLVITETDMACLLQAKAAIAAGIQCLLRTAGTTSQEVKTVFLAGGFGFHMHVDSLIGCGLLPHFRPDQIQMVGNTSLAGAYLALLDSGSLDEIRRISQRIEVIELNLDPHFELTYIDQLSLPS